MANNHTCKFRVSRAQFEQIQQDAQAKGYVRIAPYLRDLALEKNRFIESKILETHQMVQKILEVLQ